MSQITRCPSCATSFKVVPDQLRISEGWVRCGHCGHVFDATQHLQSPAPLRVAAAPSPVPQTPAPPTPEIAEPWEISLPPPPAPPRTEAVVATPLDELDFAAPNLNMDLELPGTASLAPVAAPMPAPNAEVAPTTDIDLEWPELAAKAPAVAPEPAPPVAPPVAPKQMPTPIPAASIPTDIDWPEPALEMDADPPADSSLESALSATPEAGEALLPVMPELDLAPDLAPLPTPAPATAVQWEEAVSVPTKADLAAQERIEPSGPLDWPAPPVAAAAPDLVAPPLVPEEHPRLAQRKEAPAAQAGADEPSFVRTARRQALWRKPLVRLGLALLAILLLLGLVGQVLVHDRNQLAAAQPSWRPLLELLCRPLDCTVRLHRHIASVVVESSSFNRVDGGVYHFAVTLKNRSSLMLEMPAVELTLTDANEQAVLRRVFTAQELGAGSTLAPHAEWSSTLLVRIATGNTPMAGYRVLAFYP